MISGLPSLISLNLNNFSITSEIGNYMGDMFSGCSSLISLNLKDFYISGPIDSNMFEGCNPNLIFCSKTAKLIQQILTELNSSINNCSDICFTSNHKIIKEKKKCIDYCFNDDKYVYELNDICYEIIPEGYYQNKLLLTLEKCDIM